MPERIPSAAAAPEETEKAAAATPGGEKADKIKVAFVDVGELTRQAASDAAERAMHEAKPGFVSRVWKHNLWYDVYRQRAKYRALTQIEGNKNLYAAEEGADAGRAHQETMKAIADRFVSEYDDALRAGDVKNRLGDTEKETGIKNQIQELVQSYAAGKVDEAGFQEERAKILSAVTGMSRENVDRGATYADNLLEVARHIRTNVEHGAKLEELKLDFDVIVGQAKSAVKTEAQFNAVDRIVDKIQYSKVGRFINESTAATAVAIAYSVTAGLSERVARSRALAWGTLGASVLVGGGIAALRESRRTEEDRRQHFRERAQGRIFNPAEAPRRVEMEEFLYEMRSARSLVEDLEKTLYDRKEDGKQVLREGLKPEEIERTLAHIAEIEARVKLSDRHNIDLIGYSDIAKAEQEQTHLLVSRGQSKSDVWRLARGMKFADGKTVQELLTSLTETRMNDLMKGDLGIERRNDLFRKMKQKRVVKAVVKGVITGAVVGTLAQEVASWLRGNQTGLIEGLAGERGSGNVTALEGLRRWIAGETSSMRPGPMQETVFSGHHFQTPQGVDLIQSPDGSLALRDADGNLLADRLPLDANGNLTPDARHILDENGVVIKEGADRLLETQTTAATAKDYIYQHEDLTARIQRRLWYDNDTPAPVFDKNELRLWWGGEGSSGLTADGKYQFDISRMAPDGSYHKDFSANAQTLMKEGRLKMIFSLSRDTQNQVFEIPIQPDGTASVDPHSEVGKMFFREVGGKVQFTGKFAEVAEVTGVRDGVEQMRILATHVGEDAPALTQTIETFQDVPTTVFEVPEEYRIDPPLFIPVFGRRPLEPAAREMLPPYYLYYGEHTPEELKKKFEARRSKRLKENPDAKLDHYKEAADYLRNLPKEYRKKIEDLAQQAGTMAKENRLSICIPVAGHQEGKNIYQSLENYTYQTARPEEYEIVLFVNHPDKDKEGRMIEPDETLDEVKRFQREYPEIPVRVMYSSIPVMQANMGHVRKLLNDVVLLRHHERGNDVPDLIMVSNDADNKGVSPEYIDNFIKKFDANPRKDGVLGQLDWDPEAYTKFPTVHIGTRLFQYLNIIGRRRTGGLSSSGANFAFRSSIYAGIGGYLEDPTSPGAEDVRLGQAIVEARKTKESLGFGGAITSRLYTSARRAVDAWRRGLAPIEQWDKFSAFDDEIRKLTLPEGEKVNYDDPDAQGKLKEGLEYVVNRTLNHYVGGDVKDKGAPLFRKALGWLGVKYVLDPRGDIVITDMSRLIAGLKDYQEYGVVQRDMKAGRPGSAEKFREARLRQTREAAATEIPLRSPEQVPLGLVTPELSATADTVLGSKKQEFVGDYIVAKDKALYEGPDSRIFLGTKRGQGKSVVAVKETRSDATQELARRGIVPKEQMDVESYLETRGLKEHPDLLLPLDRFVQKDVLEKDKLVRVYEAGTMDLERHLEGGKSLEPRQAAALIFRVAEGVRAIHNAGVVHGDIAPSNIIIAKETAKLGDLDGGSIEKDGIFERRRPEEALGNRFVLPPELFRTETKFDKTVDIYEMGATLFRLVAGKWPYDLETESKAQKWSYKERQKRYQALHEAGKIEFPNSVPAALRPVIKKALDPVPANRYQSAEEFVADLEQAYQAL